MIGLIENKIMELFKRVSEASNNPLGYKYRTIDSYPEDWQDYAAKSLKTLSPPMVFVTFAGWQKLAETAYSDCVQVSAKFGVIFGAKSYRNESITRMGDGLGNPGSYQLAEDGARILAGQTFGLDIEPIKIGSLQFVKPLGIERAGISLLALQIETEFSFAALGNDANDIADFITQHSVWDVPPTSTIEKEQTITLEQENG